MEYRRYLLINLKKKGGCWCSRSRTSEFCGLMTFQLRYIIIHIYKFVKHFL
ncbi:hypothetical protein HMPREF1548_03140 [Clostridium sp. KLE 1755]|nr:hypothetical protein HMPREF1548_03140 [Clostridium sp. KLE 1755]